MCTESQCTVIQCTWITVHCECTRNDCSSGIFFPLWLPSCLTITIKLQAEFASYFFCTEFWICEGQTCVHMDPCEATLWKITAGAELLNKTSMLRFVNLFVWCGVSFCFFFQVTTLSLHWENCLCRSIIQGQKQCWGGSWSSMLQQNSPNVQLLMLVRPLV